MEPRWWLIGSDLRLPTNTEMPWRVQDYDKALETEYRCPIKADVLARRLLEILDHMSFTITKG